MTARTANNPWSFNNNLKNSYNLINLVLAGIILSIFIYSFIFSPDKNNYPIISFHDYFTGQKSISTGLSRGFSCIVRGDFADATEYNRYSLRIFTFFLIQFIMRCAVFLLKGGRAKSENRIIALTDIFVSIGLFIFFFYPFLFEALTLS